MSTLRTDSLKGAIAKARSSAAKLGMTIQKWERLNQRRAARHGKHCAPCDPRTPHPAPRTPPMAGAHITIDDQALRAKLAELLTQVKQPERAMREIGEYLLRATDNRFSREVAPDGTPWAQLADITLLRRLAGIGKQGGAAGKPVGYLSASALADLGAARGTFSKRKTKTGGRTLHRPANWPGVD